MASDELNDVIAVEVVRNRTVRLTFENGEVRDVDLAPLLWGPAFEAIAAETDVFDQVRVDHEAGTIVWPNGADISPAALYRAGRPVTRAG